MIVFGRLSASEEMDLKIAVPRRLTDRLILSKASDLVDLKGIARIGVYIIDIEFVTGKYRDRKLGSTVHPTESQ